ncbi:uncharacterized protein ATC70_010882 [Mucor velutinosus]|uniref:BHLH domain-containing protein n=1 Tax=Mucor velutinosus TaxID=708070 RepID=A0AAN7DG14_9FUNG|nr:hypothetical protein ATC70_010882 [Mucor velutinosus]
MSVERSNTRKKSTPTTTTTTTTSTSAPAATTSPQLNDSSRQLNMSASSTLVSSSSNYPLGISFSSNVAQMNESDDIAYIEKRTAHNALERQRREGLNTKFQELAHVLPALQQIRRPSKSMIVAKSLEFVSSAGERENDFQGQIYALRKENEQLMRQASLSKKRMKKRLDQESSSSESGSKKSASVMIKLSSKKRLSKLKPQSRQSAASNEQPSNVPSKKRTRSEGVDQPELSTSSNKVKSPSPPCSSSSVVATEVLPRQPPSPPKISSNKRRKRNATVETYQHQHQQAMPTAVTTTAGPHYSSYHHQTIDQSLIASVDLPSYQQPQQRIMSSQRPRFNSHQPATADMLQQQQQQQQQQQHSSPVVSRHNSLTLTDQISTAQFDFGTTVAATPSQLSIIHSPFGNEHIFFNTFDNLDNIVSTIPALTTPSIGNNSTHQHTPPSTSSASSATSTNYDNSLDFIHSIMQGQDPSTNNQFYQWH